MTGENENVAVQTAKDKKFVRVTMTETTSTQLTKTVQQSESSGQYNHHAIASVRKCFDLTASIYSTQLQNFPLPYPEHDQS